LTIRPGRTGGMGGAGAYPCTARGSSVIRMRQGTVPRGRAPAGRGFGTGFSHTVEFSRNVAGLLFGDSPAVPVSCRRRSGGDGTTGLSRSSKTSHLPGQRTPGGAPPARSTPSHRSAALRPTCWASGRPPNSRRTNPVGVRRPPVFRCRRRWRRPERSSVSKNFPACSPQKLAPRATACQLAGPAGPQQPQPFQRDRQPWWPVRSGDVQHNAAGDAGIPRTRTGSRGPG
jgi:hypothetical protein